MTIGEDGFIPTGGCDLEDEMLALMLGKELGRGIGRTTYALRHDKAHVLKVERDGKSFQNIMEWEIWKWVEGSNDLEKWFAPILDISPNGRFMLMRRVKPARIEDAPSRLPAFFGDLKIENFGWLGDRFVACDYGRTQPPLHKMKQLRKVDWWSHE